MANIFDAWKKKYSKAEYELKVSEYKEKLRKHAKHSNFGGPNYVKCICTKCNLEYNGISNQLICNTCKENGYKDNCTHCNTEIIRSNKHKSTCCVTCKKTQPWKRKTWTTEQHIKFTNSKKAWYQTESGIEFKQRLSIHNSQAMIRFNQTEQGKANIKRKAVILSNTLKEKILNGTFTPKITNTRTHWDASITLHNGDIKRFRSSWEAVFWACNMYLEFETIRIPWMSSKGTKHTYIPDFFDRKLNIIYELKPRCQYIKQDEKMQCAIKYCLENNIKFIWINEMNILNYIDINADIFDIENNKSQLNKFLNGITKNKYKID